jgi:hypothetical protein
MIWHGKHSTEIYDASTPELWAQNCLAILQEMDEYGYFSEWPLDEEPEVDPLSMPEPYRAMAERDNATKRQRKAETIENNTHVATIKAVLESKDASMVTRGRGRLERQEPYAWQLLEERSDYEYERVELVKVRSGPPAWAQ